MKRLLLLASCFLLFAACPAPAAVSAAPDPAALAKELGPAAARGDNEAALKIGMAYAAAGQRAEAKKWLQPAAARGDLAAQLQLAQQFFLDSTPDGDRHGAEWTRRAAEAGDVNAQLAIALLYEKGRGLGKDPQQSVAWLKKAAGQGNATARFNLAVAYYNGTGLEQDQARAARLFRDLARAGHPGAQYNLGLMHKNGIGVKKDPVRAAAWLSLAIQGYPPGPQHEAIAQALREVKSGFSHTDENRARLLYDQLAETISGIDRTQPAHLPAGTAITASTKAPKPAGFSGFVQTGLRWQSNAGNAPSSYSIGSSEQVIAGAKPRPDHNLFFLGSLSWLLPVDGGAITHLDTRLTAYQTFQHHSANPDIGFFEISTGPSIVLPGKMAATLRPYLTADMVTADGAIYDRLGGGGVSLTAPFSKDSAMILTAEQGWARFNATSTSAKNGDQSGRQVELSAKGLHRLTRQLVVDLGLLYRTIDAKKDWYTLDSFKVTNGYALRLPPVFLSLSARASSAYASLSWQHAVYDMPNPAISPTTARTDTEWQFTLTGEIPLGENWSLAPTVQRTHRTANLAVYELDNTVVSLAGLYRF